MNTSEDGTWFEHLSPAACWSLAATASVGRVGVVVDGRPEIFPVNFGVHDDSVVFRTDDGTKLHGIVRMPWVCFEVDGVDDDRELGWSVLVKGEAREVVDADTVRELEALDVRVWGVGDRAHWVRIAPEEITGRRIGRGPGDP